MLLTDKKKSPATMILDSIEPDAEIKKKPMEDNAVIEPDMGMQSAGEELMAAIESKSPMAIMDALKAAIEMCEAAKGDSEA